MVVMTMALMGMARVLWTWRSWISEAQGKLKGGIHTWAKYVE
jgi:hypothetical protein